MSTEPPVRITRVVLKNYKSIVACDVELRPLTILVGPNGSGKSNFLDALRFVSDALTSGLDQAISSRGGIDSILSRVRLRDYLTIEIHWRLSPSASGCFGFDLGPLQDEGVAVYREWLRVDGDEGSPGGMRYTVRAKDAIDEWVGLSLPSEFAPKRSRDRLYLATISGLPEIRPAYDLLTSMAFYNLNPARMRDPKLSNSTSVLSSEGDNIASLVKRMRSVDQDVRDHVVAHLSRITPGIEGIEVGDVGGYDTLEFMQKIGPARTPWHARASQVSDGTLRGLGVLVALFQGRMSHNSSISLVGIEEPEAGLHPAAAGVLYNALLDASVTTQVIVTTHSTDLLFTDDVDVDSLLAVAAHDGVTRIGPIDDYGRGVLHDRLTTAGELLQQNHLRPATETKAPTEKSTADPAPRRV